MRILLLLVGAALASCVPPIAPGELEPAARGASLYVGCYADKPNDEPDQSFFYWSSDQGAPDISDCVERVVRTSQGDLTCEVCFSEVAQ